ncbi:heme-binding protein [Acrasis kona]|uniref:Heme-binding protein n=1 Tax=Acrasis kona TaxID=1008807 RepID=A0AAW2Z0B9_9EUKA
MMKKVVEAVASHTQSFHPLKQVCAHLNAFHRFPAQNNRAIETNHYCAHIHGTGVKQCLLYDSPDPDAKLLGIEIMITAEHFDRLPTEEKKYWHSHVYEVKSGQLALPNYSNLPEALWQAAQNKEMEETVNLYGKIFQYPEWDKEHGVPLGEPQLMMSFTDDNQVSKEVVEDRDKRFGVDTKKQKKDREYIKAPTIHPEADQV